MKITDMKAYPAAAADFYSDPTLAPELDALAASHSLLDTFQAARVRMGLSFDECARRMGITPGQLEDIDSGTDADLSHRQIAAYVAALFPASADTQPIRPVRRNPSAARPAMRTSKRKHTAPARAYA